MLPDTITSIESYAFSGCTSLTSLTFNDETGPLNFPVGLTSIGEGAFEGCTGLTTVTFPYGLETIGQYAFKNCTGLTCDLTIPTTVTSIGSQAFRGCTELKVVSSPIVWSVSPYYDYDHAFYECALKEFRVTGNPESIPGKTFNKPQFQSIRNLMVPPSVTSIGTSAFSGCDNLKNIYCEPGSFAWEWFEENGFENQLVAWHDFEPEIRVSGITVTPAAATVSVNSITSFTAEVIPEEADDRSVSWYVINGTGSGYINQSGYFIALSPGTVTVKAQAKDGSGVYGTADVVCTEEQSTGEIIELSAYELSEPEGKERVATVDIKTNESWSMNGLPGWINVSRTEGTGDAELVFSIAANTGAAREATLSFTAGGAVKTLRVYQGSITNAACAVTRIEPSAMTAETGEAVNFTVYATGADEIVLVADGKEYNHYPVSGEKTTVSRIFTQGGNRVITFRPYLRGEAGAAGNSITLEIKADDDLPGTTVHLPEHPYFWQNAEISWDAIDNADQYVLICQYGSEEIVHKTFNHGELSYTISGQLLYRTGSYRIMLMATGRGWNQSETSIFMEVTKPVATFTVSTAKNAYTAGEKPTLNVQNPDRFNIALRVTDADGDVFYLPEDGGTYNAASENNITFPPTCVGSYTVVALSWPDAERQSDEGAWCQSEPITFTVDGPTVSDMRVAGGGADNLLTTECTTLTAKTNHAVVKVAFFLDDEPVTVYENGEPRTEITTYKTEIRGGKEVRTFTCDIDIPAEGWHVYTVKAYDTAGNEGTRAYRYYAVTPAENVTRWPSHNGIGLRKTPSSGAGNRKILTTADKLTVIGTYGNQSWVSTRDGQKGFVLTEQLLPTQVIDWNSYKLTTVEPDPLSMISYPDGPEIPLQWNLSNELPDGARYVVYGRRKGSSSFTYTCSLSAAGKKIPAKDLAAGTWEMYVTVERENDPEPGVPYSSQLFSNAKLTARFSNDIVIFKNASDYMKYLVNADASSGSFDDYKEFVLTYCTILMNNHQSFTTGYTDTDGNFQEPVEIEKISKNFIYNLYGTLFNNATTIVNPDGEVARLYMINSTMNSLSPFKESDGIMIPVSFINKIANFANDFWEEGNLLHTILTNITELLKNSGVDKISGSELIQKISKAFNADLNEKLSDVGKKVTVIKTVKDAIVAVVQAIVRGYCYSKADQQKLDMLAEGLIQSGDSELSLIGNALTEMKEFGNICTYVFMQTGIELVNIGQDFGRSKIFEAMGKNPEIAPITLALTGSLAVNNVIFNVDEIQNAAHQVQWAVNSTEQYLPKFVQAMNDFRNAPASGYNHLIRAAETMAVLVHSEMKGMAAMSEAVGGAWWSNISKFFTREDKYKMYADDAMACIPNLVTYFDTAFSQFRNNCLIKLDPAAYIEWENPLV